MRTAAAAGIQQLACQYIAIDQPGAGERYGELKVRKELASRRRGLTRLHLAAAQASETLEARRRCRASRNQY